MRGKGKKTAKELMTIRITPECSQYLKMNYKNRSAGADSAISELMNIRNASLSEIKGLFTPGEWIFIASSLYRDYKAEGAFRVSSDRLITHCEDNEKIGNNCCSMYGVELQTITDKIKTLSAAQIDAIYHRVSIYWSNADRPDIISLKEWAEF